MSAQELAEWTAYERLSGPILVHDRVELMLAILCSLLANIHSSGRRFEPADFMLPRDTVRPQKSATELIAEFERIFSGAG